MNLSAIAVPSYFLFLRQNLVRRQIRHPASGGDTFAIFNIS